ncbi:DEAD/DEAH box helicase [Microbacterium terricola]|uniref:ATP-dependent RNA helicase n=1 Tax=Microbacterium terricola TaxID=344163 RepID=A0ABM8DUY8_9MICO|nr:DEAD/DEAH box helicase [Microbacterium terricola]UYK39826.1 DEAD/DEAH box helicase [Microbacterium terricola]BDV29422.1 putative ATP-dependent RNA helicase [Microbacterium terricola]
MSTFLELGVPASLAQVLAADGKTEAFPIQADTLPDSLAGRDVLGRGRTGSGKTIAFALPLVARLSGANAAQRRAGYVRGLVLAPTRELATQIAATISPLADAAGLKVTTIFGGVSQKPQEQAMRAGVDIVVACPGRLEDLMKQGVVRLDRVEITVLDEADHMADLGFLPGVTRILTATPQGGQRMLFSATLDRGVDTLVRRFLRDEVSHEVDESSVPAAAMTHRVFMVGDGAKNDLVRTLAAGQGRRILFTRTKHQAKKLAKTLTAAGIPSVDLHGNLSQGARERNLAAFSAAPDAGGVRVLVATDVAARGVHVDEVELVVHVDPPMEHKAYLHRSGRTARAGAEGTVVTVALDSQRRDVKDLLRKAGISVELEQVDADHPAVDALVGERAAHVRPVAPVSPPNRGGGAGGSGQGRSGGSGQSRSGGGRSGGRGAGQGRGGAARSESGRGESGRGGSGRGEAASTARGAGRSGQGGQRHGQSGSRSASSGSRPVWSSDARPSTGGARQPRRASRP